MSGSATQDYRHRWDSLDNVAVDGGGSGAAQGSPSQFEVSPTSSKARTDTYERAESNIRTLLTERVQAGPTAPPIESGELSISQTSPPQLLPRVGSKEKLLQVWEGRIVYLNARKLVARVVDVTAGHLRELEELEFALGELSDDDRRIARVGSVFRLEIGWRYEQGSRSRITRLYLRRLPVWKQSEMRRADEAAKALVDALEWDQSPPIA